MTRNMIKNRSMKITSARKRTNVELLAPISLCELGLPYIIAEFRNRHLLFIVDTGATESIIDSRVFLLLKEELKTRETNSSARCVDGSEITSKLSTAMRFKVNGKKCNANLSILEQTPHAFDIIAEESGLRIHGILGIDFLTSNNLILDFCNKVIVRYNANKVA